MKYGSLLFATVVTLISSTGFSEDVSVKFPDLIQINLQGSNGKPIQKTARRQGHCKIKDSVLRFSSDFTPSADEISAISNDPVLLKMASTLGGHDREIAEYKAATKGAVILQSSDQGPIRINPVAAATQSYVHLFNLSFYSGPATLDTFFVSKSTDGFAIRGNYQIPESGGVIGHIAFALNCEN